MLRDQLKRIQDTAFIMISLQVGVILNVLVVNWIFDLGWNLWSFGRYLVMINIILATLYAWAWIAGTYFDYRLELEGKTKQDLDAERAERARKKAEKQKTKELQKKAYEEEKERKRLEQEQKEEDTLDEVSKKWND